jgi:hypothetical protein
MTNLFAHNNWQLIDGTDLNDVINLSAAPAAGSNLGVTLTGGAGDDTLTAGRYITFFGGDGNDKLISTGEGAWDMSGEGGVDTFVIANDPSPTHAPYIMDFDSGEKIDFASQQADGNTDENPLLAGDFDNGLSSTLSDGDPMSALVCVFDDHAGGATVYLDVNQNGLFNDNEDIYVDVQYIGPSLDNTNFTI